MRKAVFLDRDDTLIDDMDYSADPARVRLKPGALDALRRLREAGYFLVMVTNQSGIARGRFTEAELAACHRHMQEMLACNSARLDAIYYCPYLDGPDAVVAAYRRDSDMRKPRPGMLLQAAREHDIDLKASWMVGDAPRDVEAGRAAGCGTILLATSNAAGADYVVADLFAAVDVILGRR